MTLTLDTARLILRRPEPADAAAFLAYTGSERYRRERGDRPLPEQWNYFAALMGHWEIRGYGRFLVCLRDGGTIIGHVGPLYPEGWPEREIAWHLWSDAAEGKGYAHEAARAARDHAFQTLGWDTAVSYIAPDNARSRALASRLGARIDTDAAQLPYPDKPSVVYRHPRPEARP